MKLTETINKLGQSIIEFVLDEKDSAEDKRFHAMILNYTLVRQGAGIFIYTKKHKLVSYLNPFDNSQFIYDPAEYALAAEFGVKRFPVGQAARTAPDAKAIKFARDLSFSATEACVTAPYQVADLTKVLAEYKQINHLCEEMASLFDRCADFTPKKIGEYSIGGKAADKYCRFNVDTHAAEKDASAFTKQIFLMDKNNIIGTASAVFTEATHAGKKVVGVYVYDEIVDYFKLMTEAEIKAVYANTAQLKLLEDSLVEVRDSAASTIKADIAACKERLAILIEPKRMQLMRPLFAAIQQMIYSNVPSQATKITGATDDKSTGNDTRVFIRAADGRVPAYVKLGCSATNTDNFVIHGPKTVYTQMLDDHIKAWATQQLELAANHRFKKNLISAGIGIGAAVAVAALSFFAYRAINKDKTAAPASASTLTLK